MGNTATTLLAESQQNMRGLNFELRYKLGNVPASLSEAAVKTFDVDTINYVPVIRRIIAEIEANIAHNRYDLPGMMELLHTLHNSSAPNTIKLPHGERPLDELLAAYRGNFISWKYINQHYDAVVQAHPPLAENVVALPDIVAAIDALDYDPTQISAVVAHLLEKYPVSGPIGKLLRLVEINIRCCAPHSVKKGGIMDIVPVDDVSLFYLVFVVVLIILLMLVVYGCTCSSRTYYFGSSSSLAFME